MPRSPHAEKYKKYRDDPKRIAKYLNDALETKKTTIVVKAIGDMIRAQGSSGFSRKSNLDRASLYRSFSGRMSPGLDRVMEVLQTLNVVLVVRPRPPACQAGLRDHQKPVLELVISRNY